MDVNRGVAPESPPTRESDSDYNARLICCMFVNKKWLRDCNAKGLRFCSRLPEDSYHGASNSSTATQPCLYIAPVLQHIYKCL